ncbi:g13534 [Coccomyxa viridis]|uniref:Serine/threonine-protein phosphatase n=1 Tax=Coccomyxa viridis TaxID=1274662 RepID=A0ABP1GDV5_9CHLO
METEATQPLPAPRPRPFPCLGNPPGPRCGHTLTAISGPEGDFSSAKVVLCGGATALEGSQRVDSPPASPGPPSSSGIRLAGATSDVHIMDVRSGKWERMNPQGEPPSPRAAHAAAAVGSMVVIQGGIGPAGLASEDLHVLDFTDFERPRWHRVMVQGPGPSARYAHTLALVANRFLVAMGGNDGKQTLSDAWALDTSDKPYQWRKITDAGETPSPRMYATAAARSDGLLLLCGGRDAEGVPLGDAYGLARHRDGRWEWAAAPGNMPAARYQHGAVFVGARLHISGGAVGGGRMVDDASSIVVLDTAAGAWCTQGKASEGDPPEKEWERSRCRHAVAAVGPYMFTYGGLRGSALLDDFLLADDSTGSADLSVCDPRSQAWRQWLDSAHGNSGAAAMLAEAAAEEAAAAAALGVRRVGAVEDLRCLEENLDSNVERRLAARQEEETTSRSASPTSVSLQQKGVDPRTPPTPDVRLYHRAVVVAQQDNEGSLRGLVRQLSIDQFENEGRRVDPESSAKHDKTPFFERTSMDPGNVHKTVLRELLIPRQWKPSEDRSFFLDAEQVNTLCDQAERVFLEEPTVLRLRAPVKIFGDLHGQFLDLMRLFDEYGAPSTAGDITYIDYLFLGDYVDRGAHSLETICLLLALKIEHPKAVHLIRGNHEASDINALFGFRLECIERMGDQQGLWAWQRINALFNWLPLAALIEDRIVCMHGGIGRSITRIDQIDVLKRPLTMEEGGVVLMDLLWSDPTTNDGVEGVQPSPRGPGLVTFGPDRVKEFCKANNLQMIVRAHECVMDGFERFAQGHLITLFSATNYCGTANNAGAILVLGRDLVMVPKLIHPLPPNSNGTPKATDSGDEVEEEPPTPHPMNDTWMAAINEERPPTPPRGRPANGPSLAFFE